MPNEEIKAIARRHYQDLWAKGDLAVADEIYSRDAVGHCGSDPDQTGYPEIEKDHVRQDEVAFPDRVVTIEFQLAEGDKVLTRWRLEATNTGPLFGNPASGKAVSVTGVHVHRIVDGKIVEVWAHPDKHGFMGQLGLLPQPT